MHKVSETDTWSQTIETATTFSPGILNILGTATWLTRLPFEAFMDKFVGNLGQATTLSPTVLYAWFWNTIFENQVDMKTSLPA